MLAYNMTCKLNVQSSYWFETTEAHSLVVGSEFVGQVCFPQKVHDLLLNFNIFDLQSNYLHYHAL